MRRKSILTLGIHKKSPSNWRIEELDFKWGWFLGRENKTKYHLHRQEMMNKDPVSEEKHDVPVELRTNEILLKKKKKVMGINRILIQREGMQWDYKEIRNLTVSRKVREIKEVFKSGLYHKRGTPKMKIVSCSIYLFKGGAVFF